MVGVERHGRHPEHRREKEKAHDEAAQHGATALIEGHTVVVPVAGHSPARGQHGEAVRHHLALELQFHQAGNRTPLLLVFTFHQIAVTDGPVREEIAQVVL